MNRLRLLELRDKEVAEFRNMTLVPAQEHEVMDSAFTVYERRLKEKQSLTLPTDRRPETGISLAFLWLLWGSSWFSIKHLETDVHNSSC